MMSRTKQLKVPVWNYIDCSCWLNPSSYLKPFLEPIYGTAKFEIELACHDRVVQVETLQFEKLQVSITIQSLDLE